MDGREVLDRILSANREYAAGHRGAVPVRPRRALAVVTCMDARLDVFAALGLEVGDAHIIRNAGGIVTDDVIRSLCLSQRLLDTRAIVLIGHTDCGLEGVSDDEFAARLEADTGHRPDWTAGGFERVEEAVRSSLRRLEETPFLAHRDRLAGFVYDVDTGRLRPTGMAA